MTPQKDAGSGVAPGQICCGRVKIGTSVGTIMLGGPVYTIRAEGAVKSFTFEWHLMWGPSRCTSKGDIAADPFFPLSSSFWPLFERWLFNGKHIDEFGRCILGPEIVRETCPECNGRKRRPACIICHGDGTVLPKIVLKPRSPEKAAVEGTPKPEKRESGAGGGQ